MHHYWRRDLKSFTDKMWVRFAERVKPLSTNVEHKDPYPMSEQRERYPLTWGQRKLFSFVSLTVVSHQTLGSILTNIFTLVFGRIISVEFANGQIA